jgi:hypothetical protein
MLSLESVRELEFGHLRIKQCFFLFGAGNHNGEHHGAQEKGFKKRFDNHILLGYWISIKFFITINITIYYSDSKRFTTSGI